MSADPIAVRRAPHRLLALLAVVATFLAGCGGGGDRTDEALETAAAAETVEGIVAAEIESADGDEYADSATCPLPFSATQILVDTFSGYDDELIQRALDGDQLNTAFDDDVAEGINCDRVGDIDEPFDGVGLWVIDAPTDIERFHEEFAGADGVVVDVAAGEEIYRGQVYEVCVTSDDDASGDDASGDYCEVDWLDDSLMIGVYAYGAGSADLDLDPAREALLDAVPEMVEALAGG